MIAVALVAYRRRLEPPPLAGGVIAAPAAPSTAPGPSELRRPDAALEGVGPLGDWAYLLVALVAPGPDWLVAHRALR